MNNIELCASKLARTILQTVGRNAFQPFPYLLDLSFMAASLNINDILTQVKQLEKADQLTLLQRMAYLLKRGEAKKTTSIRLTSLSGLGSEIWKSVDSIDKYIDEERQW
jgi:hypothetical protein